MATKTVPVSKRGGNVKLADSIPEGTTSFEVETDEATGVITLTPTVNISAAEYARLKGASNGHASDPANPDEF